MPGLRISVSWFDDHLVELVISASAPPFSAEVEVYERHDAPAQLAKILRGFPATAADTRQCVLGTFEPTLAGGGARFHFRCVDALGHAVVDVQVRADPQRRGHQTAEFSVPIDAAAVDRFVQQLTQMKLDRNSSAGLPTTS
jgi:hypothetical protein